MAKSQDQNRIALGGEWDLHRRDELTGLLATLTKDGPAIIDLRDCTYADSTALSALAALRIKFQEVPITLLGPRQQLRRILQITAFDKIFHIVDDE
jgi:anti-anti-sigma factor